MKTISRLFSTSAVLGLFLFGTQGALASPLASATASTPWSPVGPEGGDARAFAADPSDPSHLYLGTVSGWMYDSHDGGSHWQQLADIADRNDLVLDNILVDPKTPSTVLVGAWVLGSHDGGLFRSTDSGHSWQAIEAMKGQSHPRADSFRLRPQHHHRWHPARGLSFYRSRRYVGPHQPAGKCRDPRSRIHRHRSEKPEHHLCRHLASAVEDNGRRQDVGQHEAGPD